MEKEEEIHREVERERHGVVLHWNGTCVYVCLFIFYRP